ncbi:LysM domain-containing protein [Beauveria bassiana]|nr:LysM domain-containing protein [Beauveria bassiana]
MTKSSSSGQFCDILYQKHREQPSQDLVCSDCQIGTWKDQLESPVGYDPQYAEEFAALTASCKAGGYAFKTPSYSVIQPVPTSQPVFTCERPYTVAAGDTCSSVAQKRSVTEYGISDLNGLSIDCDPLPVGKTICIPPTCKVHKIGAADDINGLAAKYQVTVGQLVAWNPMIRLDGSNLRNLFDRSICISAPGGAVNVDRGRPEKAVPVPKNAHGDSNKNCGKWYTVKKDDNCAKISLANSVSLDDFYFLNPGVDKTCSNLWLNYAYCTQAVGDIKTYPGYPVTMPSTTFTRPAPTPTKPRQEKLLAPGTIQDCFKYEAGFDMYYLDLDTLNTCQSFAHWNNVTIDELREWNPSLPVDRCMFSKSQRYCVQKVKVESRHFNSGIPMMKMLNMLQYRFRKRRDLGALSCARAPMPSLSLAQLRTVTATHLLATGKSNSGMIKTCNRFHYVPKGGQSCDSIARENGISVPDLRNWNAIVGKDCAALTPEMAGWTIYGDGYKVSDGTLVASSSAGNKAILNTPWTDADISMDVKLDGDTGDAGFILRGSNMGTGPDAYSGYYAGISASGWVVLGRVNNGWNQIGRSNASIPKNTWQKLRVRAIRDSIEVFLGSGRTPLITARDATFGSGLVGTRVYYTGASFKSLSILPARFEDFQSMPDDWTTYGRAFNMTPNGMIVVAEGEARAADSTKYADVVVEANLAIINEVSGESGVLFRASNVEESSYRGYYAYLSLENGVVLGRQDDAGWKQLQSVKVELRRETVYNLRVEAYSSSLYVYLDGEMKVRADDGLFMRGVVGLRSAYALTQFQGMYITGQRSSIVIDDF